MYYSFFRKRNKDTRMNPVLVGGILIVVGLAFMSFKVNGFTKGVNVEAVVSKVESDISYSNRHKHNKAYVTYTYEGVEYKDIILPMRGSAVPGDVITVRINQDNPAQCYGRASVLIPAIMIILGVLMLLWGMLRRESTWKRQSSSSRYAEYMDKDIE